MNKRLKTFKEIHDLVWRFESHLDHRTFNVFYEKIIDPNFEAFIDRYNAQMIIDASFSPYSKISFYMEAFMDKHKFYDLEISMIYSVHEDGQHDFSTEISYLDPVRILDDTKLLNGNYVQHNTLSKNSYYSMLTRNCVMPWDVEYTNTPT